MRLENQRDVGFYILECGSSNDKARKDEYHLEEILESFWIQSANGGCKREYENNTRTISIRNICECEDGFLSILLNSADSRKPNPTFEHLETGEQRTEKKKDKEGIGDSVHVVIDLNPYDMGTRHLCLIEQVPGFSKTQILQFLDVESRQVCPQKAFKDLEGKEAITGPKLDLAILDDTITQDIQKGGTINGITLISDHAKGDEFDSEAWMESSKKELEIKVKKGTAIQALKQWVKDKKVKEKYNRFKVNYKTSSGKSRSALAQEKEDSFDFAFGRVEVIKLADPIESSALKEIHTELNQRMKELLTKERA
jgi:hypothetical protein